MVDASVDDVSGMERAKYTTAGRIGPSTLRERATSSTPMTAASHAAAMARVVVGEWTVTGRTASSVSVQPPEMAEVSSLTVSPVGMPLGMVPLRLT